jgi:signal peptidase II
MSEGSEAKPEQASWLAPKWRVFAIVSVLSLIADQATKIWARGALPVGGVGTMVQPCAVPDDLITHRCAGIAKPVIDGFWEWRLSMNPGSAFGLFSSQGDFARVLLSLVGIGAVIGMFYMMRKARTDQKILHWAIALVAGGAVGNLIDRIYYGVVTDFILWRYHTHEWPVFNVADIVLVVGVGLMFLDIRKENEREKGTKAERKAARAKAQEKARSEGLVKKGL